MFNLFKKATLAPDIAEKALAYAVQKGVPISFAGKFINNDKIMNEVIKAMSKNYDGFSQEESYVQHAEALAFIYKRFLSEQ